MEKLEKLDGIGRGNRQSLRAALVLAGFVLASLSFLSAPAIAGSLLHFGYNDQWVQIF